MEDLCLDFPEYSGATLSHAAIPSESDSGFSYDANVFSSDDAATAEINRINALHPSKSPVLNESSREEINGAFRLYKQELSHLGELPAILQTNLCSRQTANELPSYPVSKLAHATWLPIEFGSNAW